MLNHKLKTKELVKDYNISYISQVVTHPVANTNQFLIEGVSQVVNKVQNASK